MKQQMFSIISKGILVLALLALCGGLASAAESGRQMERKVLKLGGSTTIETSQPFTRVSLADSKIADYVVLSSREIYIHGKTVGSTSMMLWQGDKVEHIIDVVVIFDLIALKEKIHELFPNQNIGVYASETGVVLSGIVSGPEVVEEVLRLTSMFLPKAAGAKGQGEGAGSSTPSITNLLRVAGAQQVMLEVKFAEVNRSTGMDLQAAIGLDGLNNNQRFNAATGGIRVGPSGPTIAESVVFTDPFTGRPELINVPVFQGGGTLLTNFAGNTLDALGASAANIFINIDNFTAALQFLESEGLARTLAEPRLVTVSGKEASFLAGGEFPIPVPGTDGNFTIEFKEFGVALSFTPIVLSDGRISLRVAPSVSNITEFRSGPQGAQFPVLTTRKLETNVELHDGQTLALAGLLQENLNETVRKVPGLGDIPILGALFRSSNYVQQKTDLLIAVTPHLVTPVLEGSLRFPGEDIQQPNRYEFYLEGRLEGRRPLDAPSALSSHNFSALLPPGERVSGGLEGEFGHGSPGRVSGGAGSMEMPMGGQGAVGHQPAPD
jgi:pilus assembly protein CpaC